jgi:FlaA1/EpsC-like NDP-sugar epimerase
MIQTRKYDVVGVDQSPYDQCYGETQKHQQQQQPQRPLLKNKIILITGANNGIGKETAYQLASLGGTVLLLCRDENRANSAIQEIRAKLQHHQQQNQQEELTKSTSSYQNVVENIATNNTKQH